MSQKCRAECHRNVAKISVKDKYNQTVNDGVAHSNM